jgi:hypothetical protein
MKSSSNQNQYSLQNSENYKSLLENSLNDVLDKYILLICEYMRFITENIKMKNKAYFKFILIRGLETITHVFNNILYYTKNVELSYYHGQKAFYYYVEFIGQISEDQHVFLQLSSRDASMYVYKKTIFEISNDNRKISTYIDEEISKKLKGIQIYMQIYKNIINYLLTIEPNFKQEIIEFFIYRFEILCNKINSVILTNEESKVIDLFIDNLNSKVLCIEKYFDVLDFFVKRICKTKLILCEKKIKQKILDDDFDTLLQQNSEKFIIWIFS